MKKFFSFIKKYPFIIICLLYIILTIVLLKLSYDEYIRLKFEGNHFDLPSLIGAVFTILLVLFHPKNLSTKQNNILFVFYSCFCYITFNVIQSFFVKAFAFEIDNELVFAALMDIKIVHSIITLIKIKTDVKTLIKRILILLWITYTHLYPFVVCLGWYISLPIYVSCWYWVYYDSLLLYRATRDKQ